MTPEMNPPQQNGPVGEPAVSHSLTTSPKPTHRKRWLLVAFLAIVLVAGGYYLVNNKNKPAANSLSVATNGSSPTTGQTNSTGQVHYVQSVGYPYDFSAKQKVTVSLGLPSDVQGVRISSTIPNQGASQYFTDKFNDEIARYEIGYPTDPEDNGGGTSELSVLALSYSWRKSTTNFDFTGINSQFGIQDSINSPADKENYITQLKNDTATCVKNPTKGFTTKGDIPLNICYYLSFGREGYSPYMELRGYGELQGEPIILVGSINIYDPTNMPTQEAALKAIADAKNGNYTTSFKQSLNQLLSALAQTQIKLSANNPSQ